MSLIRTTLLTVLIAAAGAAQAGPLVFPAYEATAVTAAQQQGDRVLLVFTKPGCPVCTRQIATLRQQLQDPRHADLRLFQVNVIEQPALARQYGVRGWSVLVLFDDGKELARAQGISAADDVAKLLDTGRG